MDRVSDRQPLPTRYVYTHNPPKLIHPHVALDVPLPTDRHDHIDYIPRPREATLVSAVSPPATGHCLGLPETLVLGGSLGLQVRTFLLRIRGNLT